MSMLDRRSLLLGAGAGLALAGCTEAPPPRPLPATPRAARLIAAARRQIGVTVRYDAAYAILADQPITNLVSPDGSNPPFATAVALPITIPTTKLTNATTVAVPGATVSPSSSDPGVRE